MMMRDERGAKLVNLSEKSEFEHPSDIYAVVADRVAEEDDKEFAGIVKRGIETNAGELRIGWQR